VGRRARAALLGTGLGARALAAELPAALGDVFELAVAAMLILLGARAVIAPCAARATAGAAARARRRRHSPRRSARAPPPRAAHAGAAARWSSASATVSPAAARSPRWCCAAALDPAPFAYMALFSAGSIAGMCALSGLAGWPLARIARHPRARGCCWDAAAPLSAAGRVWGWPVAGRLF
jgi:hypothetical protein